MEPDGSNSPFQRITKQRLPTGQWVVLTVSMEFPNYEAAAAFSDILAYSELNEEFNEAFPGSHASPDASHEVPDVFLDAFSGGEPSEEGEE